MRSATGSRRSPNTRASTTAADRRPGKSVSLPAQCAEFCHSGPGFGPGLLKILDRCTHLGGVPPRPVTSGQARHAGPWQPPRPPLRANRIGRTTSGTSSSSPLTEARRPHRRRRRVRQTVIAVLVLALQRRSSRHIATSRIPTVDWRKASPVTALPQTSSCTALSPVNPYLGLPRSAREAPDELGRFGGLTAVPPGGWRSPPAAVPPAGGAQSARATRRQHPHAGYGRGRTSSFNPRSAAAHRSVERSGTKSIRVQPLA